jgi:hypothetical protein
MKSGKFSFIIMALAILFIMTAIILNNCTGEEVSVVGVDKTKPTIDLDRPSVTETATFALG